MKIVSKFISTHSMNIQNVTAFLDVVKKYKLLYESCECDFLLVKENKQWTALCITVRLTSNSNPAQIKETFSIKDRLRVIKKIEKFDINRFNKVLHTIAKGNMSLSGERIAIPGPISSFFKIYDNPNWNYLDLRDAEGWPATVLLFGGKQISDIISDLDDLTGMIQIHESNSYDSLPTLCKELLGFPIYPGDSSRVYIVAPFYKKLENMRLYQNTILSGTFKCHKFFDPSEFRLSVIYNLTSGEQISSNITFKSPEKETQFKEFEINERKENIAVKQAVLHLVHNEKKIQTYYVQTESTGPSLKDIPIHNYVGIEVESKVVETTDVTRDDVITLIDSFNVLSKVHLGCQVFINNAMTLAGLSRAVKSKEEFTLIMATIASIINEVHTQDILNQLDTKPKEPGSINLIEHLLQQKDSIETLRKLYRLRSKMRPIHSGEHEIVPVLIELGINYPDSNWDQAARKCIKLFLLSIQSLHKNLADIESTRSSYTD